MKHKHHIIPKHRINNWFRNKIIDEYTRNWLLKLVIEVDLQEHIKIHEYWYSVFGNKFDMLAAKRLSGAIGKEEHILGVLSESGKIGGKKSKPPSTWSTERKTTHISSWTGRKHTEETKKKISEKRIKSGTGSGVNNPFYGKKHTTESKEKMKLARKQRIIKPETKVKQSLNKLGEKNHNYGKKMSDDIKQKIYIKITCPHCQLSGCRPSMIRWHFDKCKLKEKQ